MRRRGDVPPVGRSGLAWAPLGLLATLGALGACAGTTGLVLGERAASDDASSDAGLLGLAEDGVAPGPDAGCPTCTVPVALSGVSLTSQQGGTTGSPYTDTCPGSQAVIGYEGFLTPPSAGLTLVGGIQALCGEMYFSADGLTTSAGATLPIRGTSQDAPWTQLCPTGAVVVGFSGRSGADLDQVAFVCASLVVSDDDAGSVLTPGPQTTLTPAGGDGGMPYDDACPPGQVARGSNLRSGEWVDAFGLVCGAPALVPGGDP
jgi:hypothetical protein